MRIHPVAPATLVAFAVTVACSDASDPTNALDAPQAELSAVVAGGVTYPTVRIRAASSPSSPADLSVPVRGTASYRAQLTDKRGTSWAGRQIAWRSTDTTVAKVTVIGYGRRTGAIGFITTHKAGTAKIVARTQAGTADTITLAVGTTDGRDPSTKPPADTAPDPTPSPGPSPAPKPRGGYYVAPTGSASGDGTQSRPWDLATALAHPGKVRGGDTIWLRGGTYKGAFTSRLTGTSSAPIVVRQYPGERATIDGNLAVQGGYTYYWGFEVMSSVANPRDVAAVDVHAPGTKFINMVVHDAGGNGFGLWSESPDAEVYGSLIYNNGRQRVVPAFAHGIYGQNNTGRKRLADNLVFNQFGYGVHMYGSDAAYLRNITIDGNVAFNNGLGSGMDYHVGGSTKVEGLRFTNNYSYRDDEVATARFGFSWGPMSSGAVITDNYLTGKVYVHQWQGLTFTRNTLVKPADWEIVHVMLQDGQSTSGFSWDGNSYFKGRGTDGGPFAVQRPSSSDAFDIAAWRSKTGFDRSSSFTAGLPGGAKVVVRPNEYEAGRANVIVYNWGGAGAVSVDLSRVLKRGDEFEVREVQNYFGSPAVTGTYNGGSVSLPMGTVSVPPAVGGWPSRAPTTGNEFHAFVVLKRDKK